MRIREAEGADAPAILELLRGLHAEAGRHPLDDERAFAFITDTVNEHVAFVVIDGDRMIASVGLRLASVWYAQADMLTDAWCYVAPEYRDGEAFAVLCGQVRLFCDATGLEAWIAVTGPRPRPRGGMSRIATAFGYQPAAVLSFAPEA